MKGYLRDTNLLIALLRPSHEKHDIAGVRLLGHQEVTDAYLLGLAMRRGGVLATLDGGIAALTEPNSAESRAVVTVA